MANHFYGAAIEEHYEKEIKDLTTGDWVVVAILIGIVLSVVASIFCKNWGLLVILLGVIFCYFDVMVRLVFHKKSKVTPIFVALGILVIIAGLIVKFEAWDLFQYYVTFSYALIAFTLGVVFIRMKINNSKMLREYSLEVEAVCEMVDIKNINLFRFDDLIDDPYNAPINSNTIFKPGFHYTVNGQEYFTESTVYYGDLNKEFVEGNKVILKVNPQNPNEILPVKADTTIGNLAMVMGIFWLIAGIIGIVVLTLMLNGVISFR